MSFALTERVYQELVIYEVFHIFLIRSDYFYGFMCLRVFEWEGIGVEELTRYTIFSSGKAIFSSISIRLITNDWSSDRREMDTDLMHATSFYSTFEKTILIANICTKSTIMSNGFLTKIRNNHFWFILGIFFSKKFCSYRISWFRWNSYHDCVINLFYLSILKERKQWFEHFFFFCDHDDPARISIDPMDERWLPWEGIVRGPEIVLHLFDERDLKSLVISWMDIDTRWLIENKHSFIFIENRKSSLQPLSTNLKSRSPRPSGTPLDKGGRGDLFLESSNFLIWEINLNHITFLDSIGLFYFFSIHFYFSCPEPLINSSERSFAQIFLDKFIYSLAGIRWWVNSEREHSNWKLTVNNWQLRREKWDSSVISTLGEILH